VNNAYVPLFKTALELMPTDDYKVIIRADETPTGEHQRQFNAPTLDEVAIVMFGNEFGSDDIVLEKRNNTIQRVAETHRSYDAFRYPLIFWAGRRWLPLSNTTKPFFRGQPYQRKKVYS
jgi:hypothetical protein